MNEQYEFIRAMRERPDDDGLRLIYADWIEEQGDSIYAEFIRIQISGDRPVFYPRLEMLTGVIEEFFGLQHSKLTRSGFASGIYPTGQVSSPHKDSGGACQTVLYQRGLITCVYCTLEKFLKFSPRLACAHTPQKWIVTNASPAKEADEIYYWTEGSARSSYGEFVERRPDRYDFIGPIFEYLKNGDKISDCADYKTEAQAVLEFQDACLRYANSEADKLVGATATL